MVRRILLQNMSVNVSLTQQMFQKLDSFYGKSIYLQLFLEVVDDLGFELPLNGRVY